MKSLNADVAVIGGGAAGMFASAECAKRGFNTVLIEHGEYTGRKLGITGKGRCNVTNDCSEREFLDNIPTNSRFLYSAISNFTPSDAKAYFENLRVPLKTERGRRVFPVSDSALDIVKALRKNMEKSGVKVIYDNASEIITEKGSVKGVACENSSVFAHSVIVCTGGASYPLTGSDGSGYELCRKLGHTVIEPKASLVPLEEKGDICSKMQGLSLKNVTLKVLNNKGKTIFEEQGEMLFTHFGLSGPLVLSASSHMRNFAEDSYKCLIDLKPALDEKKLDIRILRDFEKFSNRDFANSLSELLPRKMIPVIIEMSRISPDTKVNSVTKEERGRLLSLIKAFPVEIEKPCPVSDAIITSGGISVKEIDPKTMGSKLVKGLHFAGEVIDVDGYTGGFNLQIAWCTAYAAASHIE